MGHRLPPVSRCCWGVPVGQWRGLVQGPKLQFLIPLGDPCGQGHTGCSQMIILQIVLVLETLFLKLVPLLVFSGGIKKHLKVSERKLKLINYPLYVQLWGNEGCLRIKRKWREWKTKQIVTPGKNKEFHEKGNVTIIQVCDLAWQETILL